MAIKLLMTWDILPGREQEYFEFVVREFIPGLQKLGLEPSDAWYTMYGDRPQIVVAAQMETLQGVEQLLATPDWHDLINRLMDYVENFSHKVVEARQGFQM